ncbi:NADH peroxidase [Fusobacterium varium]|nr:NADH peroxidase [Fusobacterium varium]
MRKVIIVGGVAAGMSAASKAKREKKDLEITVYEMTDIISWGSCGLPYYVGNFYDDSKRMIAKPLEQFKKEGITVKMKHEVIGVDIEKKEVSVKNLATQEIFKDRYDELIITTGASAVKPPIKNIDLENVFTLKEFSDGIVLKKAMMKPENKRVVIIGAGYIGLEAAEAAVNLKKEVRIIQLGDRVIPGSFDKEITDIMEEEIRGHKDVFLNLDEAVSEFEGKDGRVSGVKTNKGVYPADIVILATGVRPNTKFLEGTGIETLKNGAIVIDGRGRSSIKDIYAAGDCATVYHKLKKKMYIFH